MAKRKKKAVVREPITSQKIECAFRKTSVYGSTLPQWNPNSKKCGSYSNSRWSSIPKKRYAVLAYVDGDFDPYIENETPLEEIAWACVNYLNTPPHRKKFGRRSPKPLYGTLVLIRHTLKRGEDGKPYFEMLLSTEHQKNKHFWGAGYGVS